VTNDGKDCKQSGDQSTDQSPCFKQCCGEDDPGDEEQLVEASPMMAGACVCRWANESTCAAKPSDTTPCWEDCCGYPYCNCNWANDVTCDSHAQDGTPCWGKCCGDNTVHHDICECNWVNSPNACDSHANDGTLCWGQCCGNGTAHHDICDCSWINPQACDTHANDGSVCWGQCCAHDKTNGTKPDGTKPDGTKPDGTKPEEEICDCTNATDDGKACEKSGDQSTDENPCFKQCCGDEQSGGDHSYYYYDYSEEQLVEVSSMPPWMMLAGLGMAGTIVSLLWLWRRQQHSSFQDRLLQDMA